MPLGGLAPQEHSRDVCLWGLCPGGASQHLVSLPAIPLKLNCSCVCTCICRVVAPAALDLRLPLLRFCGVLLCVALCQGRCNAWFRRCAHCG